MKPDEITAIATETATILSGMISCPHKISDEQAANLIEVAAWYKKFKNWAIVTIVVMFVFGGSVSYTIIEKVNKIAKFVKLDEVRR